MIKIYQAKSNEATEIKQLLKTTWLTTYSSIFSPETIELLTSEWHAVELLVKQIQNPKNIFLVAKDGNKIVGMCNALLTHKNVLNIQRLHVLPSYQRQGIGSELLNVVLKSFSNIETADLEVEVQNNKAQAFYRKQGFEVSGEKTFDVKNVQIKCYVMKKILV